MTPLAPPMPAPASPPQAAVRTARALETRFLAEMLGHTGLAAPRADFGGGIGEEQFASFLREEVARSMVAAGGIGLTEHILRAMTGGADAR